jgi:hypothetical protein
VSACEAGESSEILLSNLNINLRLRSKDQRWYDRKDIPLLLEGKK